MTTIYPPHFFKRYRERIVKDIKSSGEDIIKQYLVRNSWGFVAAPSDAKYEGTYTFFEPEFANTNLSFVCISSEGFSFGEKQRNINVIETIVSEDMLFNDQKEVFARLKEDFDLSNKSVWY